MTAQLLATVGATLTTFFVAHGVLRLVRLPRAIALVVAALLTLGAHLVPVSSVSLNSFLRTLVEIWSAGFFVLAANAISVILRRPLLRSTDLLVLCGVIFLCGAVLYPSALGLLPFELYALGFEHDLVLPAAVPVLLLALATRSAGLLAWIGVACLLRLLGAIDSANAWDYFVDPVSWSWAVLVLIRAGLSGVGSRMASGQQKRSSA